MKVQKLLTLDIEVVEQLNEEDNASGMINEMLIEYYKTLLPDSMSNKDKLVILRKRVGRSKLKEKQEKELKKYDGN